MKNTILLATLCLASFSAQVASADTYTLTVGMSGPYILGDVLPPASTPSGSNGQLVRDIAMVNAVLALSPGTYNPAGGCTEDTKDNPCTQYYRSTTYGDPLPAAVSEGAYGTSSYSAVDGIAQFVLPGAFQYLVVTWDGRNSGSRIYYIASLPGGSTIQVPLQAAPTAYPAPHLAAGNRYTVTHYSVFNPTTVPDGGSAAMLLGAALLGLAGFRRMLK